MAAFDSGNFPLICLWPRGAVFARLCSTASLHLSRLPGDRIGALYGQLFAALDELGIYLPPTRMATDEDKTKHDARRRRAFRRLIVVGESRT